MSTCYWTFQVQNGQATNLRQGSAADDMTLSVEVFEDACRLPNQKVYVVSSIKAFDNMEAARQWAERTETADIYVVGKESDPEPSSQDPTPQESNLLGEFIDEQVEVGKSKAKARANEFASSLFDRFV